LTQQASIIGTPQYMAPEQARGLIEEIDERTDQFSLAAITYELITGQPPFRGEVVDAILYQVVHELPAPFARPMPSVEKVVLRGMAKNKAERYASVREFQLALAEAVKSDGRQVAPAVPPTLLTPDTYAKVEEPAPREPTAILDGHTTLGSAAKAVSRDTQEARQGARRFSRAAILVIIALVGVGGAAVLLWPRRVEESKQTAPAESPAPSAPATPPVASRKDASPPDVRPDLSAPAPEIAQPEPAAKYTAPAKDEAKPATRKKKSRIRMEDL
jgi:serine/threonine protein kinase